MLKYIWIIILAFFVLIFIGYTVFAIYKTTKETIDYAEIVHNSSVDIKGILSETWDNFVTDHNLLIFLWMLILIVSSASLFVISLYVYVTLGG